jgi:hypothetical protein
VGFHVLVGGSGVSPNKRGDGVSDFTDFDDEGLVDDEGTVELPDSLGVALEGLVDVLDMPGDAADLLFVEVLLAFQQGFLGALIDEGAETFELPLLYFLVLLILDFVKHLKLPLPAQGRIAQSVQHCTRNGIQGGSNLGLHCDEVIIDGLLEQLRFGLGVWPGHHLLAELLQFLLGNGAQFGGMGVVTFETSFTSP